MLLKGGFMDINIFSFNFEVGDVQFNISKYVGEGNKEVSPLGFHTHNEHEMFFVDKDGLVLGSMDKQIEYDYGTVVIVPPNFTHYSYGCKSTVSFSFCKIEKAREKYYDAFTRSISIDKPTTFNKDDGYFWLWNEIKNCLNFSAGLEKLRLKTALQLLIIKILEEKIKPANSGEIIVNKSYLFTIDNFLNDKFREQVYLKDLAKELCLSQRQVSRIISKIYGASFSKILAQTRLRKAEILLLKTDKSISDICQSVGFINESNFFTLFKKQYGCTPLQFRVKHIAQN